MRIKYLKLKNWLLVTLGGLLGVSLAGCEKIFNTACEYGCPEATYHVKGTVTDEHGQPVAGIGVDDNVTTGADGNYAIDFPYIFPREAINIAFRDIDGEENGSYNDTVVSVKTDGVALTGGDGNWYEGEGTITQDVVLTKKE